MNPLKMALIGIVSAVVLIVGIVLGGLTNLIGGLCVVSALAIGLSVGVIIEWVHEEKRMDGWENQCHKLDAYYRLFNQWLSLKQEGKNLAEYLQFNEYKSVAIYGMSTPGERLIEELEYTDIEIKYVVDRNADNIVARQPKYKSDDELPKVDVMIVTAILAFQDIQEDMEKKVDFPIISLEDMVYGLA